MSKDKIFCKALPNDPVVSLKRFGIVVMLHMTSGLVPFSVVWAAGSNERWFIGVVEMLFDLIVVIGSEDNVVWNDGRLVLLYSNMRDALSKFSISNLLP